MEKKWPLVPLLTLFESYVTLNIRPHVTFIDLSHSFLYRGLLFCLISSITFIIDCIIYTNELTRRSTNDCLKFNVEVYNIINWRVHSYASVNQNKLNEMPKTVIWLVHLAHLSLCAELYKQNKDSMYHLILSHIIWYLGRLVDRRLFHADNTIAYKHFNSIFILHYPVSNFLLHFITRENMKL